MMNTCSRFQSRRHVRGVLSSVARRIGAIGACALLLGVVAPPIEAAIQTQLFDDVWPLDNPFTTGVDEGLPDGGSNINASKAMTAAAQGDPRTTYGPLPVDYAPPYFESRLDIIVGRTSNGTLTINGGSDLRYEDLIIGGYIPGAGPEEGGPPTTPTRGSGTVRIEGAGSLFNNNFNLLPPALAPGNPFGITWGPSIRAADAGTNGFDLFVGRQYDGALRLSLGGRVEVQDAIVVGDEGLSVGRIDVDGFESTIVSGGFMADPDDGLPHQMTVGRLGSGTMNVTNGGRVISVGPSLGAGELIVGAVIGSDAFAEGEVPQASGEGTVNITGSGSTWTVAGNLQIGGFHDSVNVIGNTEEDLDGNDVDYSNVTNEDILNVGPGALVSLISPVQDPMADQPERLDVVVGRTGRIIMTGGQIESLGFLSQTTPTSNPDQEILNARLINDGVISGNGNIATLQFRNRVLGEIRVGAGQKLLFSAGGRFLALPNIPVPGEEEYPLSNYGLIEVIGTDMARAEIEFDRQPGHPTDPAIPIRPFLNLPTVDGPGLNGRTGGEILAQNGTLRFRSDIINRHKVSFTGGTNLVSGNFFNEGTVFVAGNNTSVTFIDEFINSGVLQLEPNISLVMFIDNVTFLGGGSLSTSFGGRPTGQEISMISSAEDMFLGGALNASLFTAPGVPGFSPQPGDQFEIISTAGDLVGDFATVDLPDCIGDLCFVGFPDYTLDSYFIRAFSIVGALGANFNGDAIVDDLDLQIWRQNVGRTGPPGTIPGDANNDGIVNGQDLFIWQMQLGTPGMMVPGAGGGGLASNSIPEPASAMLLVGGLLALAVRRRRVA